MELIEAHHRYRSAAGAAAALGRVRHRVCGAFDDDVGNKTEKVNKAAGLVAQVAHCITRSSLRRKPRLLRKCTTQQQRITPEPVVPAEEAAMGWWMVPAKK
jgi:hypothetical protein